MKIVELIPGSGDAFYCENCLRDGTFFRALHDQGHDILRLPMYLPIASNELEEHTAEQRTARIRDRVYRNGNLVLASRPPV